ncbi:MAG: c-type cytochrome [Sulfurisoma sp.]|nr:c-type cytochrome [Sulfurisoma sp.]
MTVARERIAAMAALVALVALATPALAADGAEVHGRACKKCHRTGVDDAPITGDREAWAPLVKTGREALIKSVIDGKGKMEPRANRPELTDEEIAASVDYFLELVK